MTGTWDFNLEFQIKKHNLANILFFESAILRANYSEVIVNEEGRVLGYLFGEIPGKAMPMLPDTVRSVRFLIKAFYHYIARHLGPGREVMEVVNRISRDESELLEKRRKTDAYVNIFFVASALRGQGWGKRLMDKFVEQSKSYGAKRIYLWTDLGCNYQFYDHAGFTVVARINSPLLEKPEEEFNGFAYAKVIS